MEVEQRKDFINDLDSELERLIALVNDLLELSRLEKTTIEFEDVDLKLFLSDAIGEYQYRYARAGLELLDNLKDQSLVVRAAPFQLRQVVSNLLDNAYNYTPAGGTVTVSLDQEGNEAIITVEDSGCGIPKEDLDYIFERFFRVERARSREGGGTGLGLAIVKEIIAKHGGRVWVESEETRGSRFMVALPLSMDPNVSKS